MSTDIELIEPAGRTLFRTDDPAEVLAAARDVADVLKSAIEPMVVKIGRSEHLRIEAYQTLGSMLGISAHVVWSKPLPAGNGWEARAEARTVDGRVVGSAEAMVTREERNWTKAEDYAIRSMSQTRAMSKALRGPLGFIVTLSGHSATPAEEVIVDAATSGATPWPAWAQPVHDVPAVADELTVILQAAGIKQPSEQVTRIGQHIMNNCNGTIPVAVQTALEQITEAIDAPPAPAPDNPDAPEASE